MTVATPTNVKLMAWQMSCALPKPVVRTWRTGTTALDELEQARFWTAFTGLALMGLMACSLVFCL